MEDQHPKAKLKPLGQRPVPRPRLVRQEIESSSSDTLDRMQKSIHFGRKYPIFREELNEALAKATHTKLPIVQIKPKVRYIDEGVSERLAAVTEVKKTMILGTDQTPHEFAEGYKETHFNFLKMNLDEHQSGLDKAIRRADTQADWRQAVTRFLDLAKTVHPIENPKGPKGMVRQRRGGIVKHRSAVEFNAKIAWKTAITRIISVLRTMKEEMTIDTTGIEKGLLSQLKDFQSKTDSQTLTKVI
jgi:hypothetical protein